MYSILHCSKIFNQTRILSTDFRKKKIKYKISRKSLRMEAELFHADGQTDMTLLIASFRVPVKEPGIPKYEITSAQG